MPAVMEFDVVPESALQNEHISFTIGMPLCQTIAYLQPLYQIFRGIELLYDERDPLSTDIVLNLTNDGIKLIFDSYIQLLKIIEIVDLTKVSLSYCGNLFSSPTELPTIEKINQTFSATHPGVYDSEQRVYTISWRGLSVLFPADSNVTPDFAHGLSSLQFSDDASMFVSKLAIYYGSSLTDAKAPEMPISCYNGNCYSDNVEVLRENGRTRGLRVHVKCERFDQSSYSDSKPESQVRDVLLGDCTQKIASALGCPSSVYYKSEDKMKIHLPSTQRMRQNEKADYFYNYFTLGVDVLFDATTNTAKKFILHTNFPGHYDFGIYYRCNFTMHLGQMDSFVLTSHAKWSEIESIVSDADGKAELQRQPVVLNRCASSSDSNPFGSTFCFGFEDVIFEVMANGHIATIMLFDSSNMSEMV